MRRRGKMRGRIEEREMEKGHERGRGEKESTERGEEEKEKEKGTVVEILRRGGTGKM